MTTGVCFLLLAALVVAFFAICIWANQVDRHEKRLEQIIQMQQLTLSCRDNSISWANTLLSDWVTQLVLFIKDDSHAEIETGDEVKTESQLEPGNPSEVSVAEGSDSVEESA